LKAPHLVSSKHCWLEHQQCCVANAPRGFLQIAEYAVMTARDGVAVNLYIPGTFKSPLPAGGELALAVKTDYPESGTVNLRVNPGSPQNFSIALRIPEWSKQTIIKVNDSPLKDISPDSYFKISRMWKAGDRIELQLDLRGRVTRFPDAQQPFMAVERGPVVLALDSVFANSMTNAAVTLAADKDGYVPLKAHRTPKGFWMAFDVPLAGGGKLTLCDYSSVGECYKQPIADYFSPPKAGKKVIVPRPNLLPAGGEDFRVWLPAERVPSASAP
jgi:hypothetical protein